VLRDGHASAGDDERRDRRDVERAAAVATGPARVDHRLGRRDGGSELEHRAGQTVDLVDGLALRPEGQQERADHGRRCFAVHDRPHRVGGFVGRKMLSAGEPQQEFRPHVGVRHEARQANSGRVRTSPACR
jgi:hypothetical protein